MARASTIVGRTPTSGVRQVMTLRMRGIGSSTLVTLLCYVARTFGRSASRCAASGIKSGLGPLSGFWRDALAKRGGQTKPARKKIQKTKLWISEKKNLPGKLFEKKKSAARPGVAAATAVSSVVLMNPVNHLFRESNISTKNHRFEIEMSIKNYFSLLEMINMN